MLTMVKRNASHYVSRVFDGARIAGVCALLTLNAVPSVFAAQRVIVNEAHIEVSDQSQRTQQAALKEALKQVFVKMSGSTAVLDNAGVKAALRTPQAMLRSYRFDFDANRTYYVAEFDNTKLTELLQREMLPLWGDRRPETIVWMAQDVSDEDKRTILEESSQSELTLTLKQTAKKRGIPLSLPLMDLTDNVNITIYDVWGRFVEPLQTASVRYGIDNIIGARVYKNDPTVIPELPETVVASGTVDSLEDVLDSELARMSDQNIERDTPEGVTNSNSDISADSDVMKETEVGDNAALGMAETNANTQAQPLAPFTMDEFTHYAKRADEGDFALDWVFIGGGKVSYGSIYGDTPELLASELVDAYSNYLSSLYAVVGIDASKREVLTVSIANVGTIGSYANVKAYLNSLSVIESATLIEQSGTVATFALTLVGTVDDLLNSVRLETKLRPVTDAHGESVEGHSFYWSN
ncbi:hypothetical protein KUL152_11080 [Tenacibaculum sp. KUL152]|nr:hypothetical protein KUL152_11080 [Tenacibaculum sp. KUL152]